MMTPSRDRTEPNSSWTHLDRAAGVGIAAHGRTLADLFVAAARGMFSMVYVRADAGGDETSALQHSAGTEHISLGAPDAETLLVQWLNALLDTVPRQLLVTAMHIDAITPTALTATITVVPLPSTMELLHDIKAATYQELTIQKQRNGHTANIVFDV